MKIFVKLQICPVKSDFLPPQASILECKDVFSLKHVQCSLTFLASSLFTGMFIFRIIVSSGMLGCCFFVFVFIFSLFFSLIFLQYNVNSSSASLLFTGVFRLAS